MHKNIISKITGNTPFLQLSETLYAKLESSNPSGSVKDRMAKYILDEAEKAGKIKPGASIVEATSGNTGIAFSMLAAERGYNMTVVMPSDMSEERKRLIYAYGAKIIETDPGDFIGAVNKANEVAKQSGAFQPNQFSNKNNVRAHELTTGVEILKDVKNLKIDAFISGIGTGGTLMGVSKTLINSFPNIKIVAVEAEESAILSGGIHNSHSIQGISDGFIPEIVNPEIIDEIIKISSVDAIERTKRLSKEQGILVGISSGANVEAAERYIAEHNPKGIVVTILPDNQERYFSLI